MAKAEHQTLPSGETPDNAAAKGGACRNGLAWKLFVAWVIVPPLLLCMAELGLRLAGSGISTELFVPGKLRGETVYTPNRAFFQQFYTGPSGGPPHEFSMPAAKPADTYRVFVFGSSAAQGCFAPDFSFWRILDTMLRASQHRGRTEIYSMALGAANSHVMRAAAKACAAYQPDLLLVYMGNNELCCSITQSMGWDWLPPAIALPLLHLSIGLNKLRLVQLVHGITTLDFDRLPDGIRSFPEPERNYQYFSANVNDMCTFAREAGAQVILCTVGTRLRECLPQGKHEAVLEPKAAREWDDAYSAGNTLREEGRIQEALAAYTRAAGIDSAFAGLAYGIACCHYALGEYADARPWFVRAHELDRNDLRGAGTRINDILRGIVTARAPDGVRLADAAQSLADASPHGIEGPEFFLDRMHLSFEGNYVIARSVMETLARMGSRLCVQLPPPSVEGCRLRMAMTPADRRDQLALMTKNALFKLILPKGSLERALAELDAQVGPRAEGMRLEAFRQAEQTDPQNELVRIRHAQLLMHAGDAPGALEQAKVLVADFPYSWQAHRLLAQLFAVTGDKKGAIEALNLMSVWRPVDAETRMDLGQLLYEENRPEAALTAFRAAFRLRPSAQAQSGIALVLLKQGDLYGAIKAFRRSLDLQPDDFAVFEGYITALCDANRKTEAGSEIERWRAAGSDQAGRIALLHEKAGQTQDALRLFKLAVVSSGGDTASCFALQEFLDRNASAVSPLSVWREIAGQASSAQAWRFYEQSLDRSEVEERMRVYRQLLRIVPDDLDTATKLQGLLDDKAERLEAAGDLPGALVACREAIPLNPQNNQPALRLEKALSKSSPAERRNVWEEVWKDNPGNAFAAAFCGSARAATGDIAGAKENFAAALRIIPDEWYFCVVAADAFAAAGAWNDAADTYERALALNPKLDYLQGRLDEARKQAGKDSGQSPTAPPAPAAP